MVIRALSLSERAVFKVYYFYEEAHFWLCSLFRLRTRVKQERERGFHLSSRCCKLLISLGFSMEHQDLKRQASNPTPSPTTRAHVCETPCKPPDPDCIGGTSNQCYTVNLFGMPIAALIIDGQERLCLAQISNTLLKKFSYNEIHNRRVALGITCVQCTPVQLEILRRANAMPVSSRRCGMINKREAERLCKSFLTENRPPKLPDNFSFDVYHECTWGCRGAFVPSRYNSSRAKCIRCAYCNLFSSPNKFIFHAHRTPTSKFHPPDGPNFNSWRRHIKLVDPNPSEDLLHAWEDVKAMFNGGSRKRSVCETSNKLAPSSFGRPVVDPISLSSEAQRLLPSPPTRSRYDKDPHQDLEPTPPGAVNIPYPLMPIPSRTLSTSMADTLPEDTPMNSSPPYSVGAIFPGQLSPPAFRQHPFMELVWSGGRTGYPLPAAAIWPKTIGMPFAGNPGYYQPLMEPDNEIHTMIDVAPASNHSPAKRPHHQWDDFDPMKFRNLKPKNLTMRHHFHHHHLPDLRSRNAYYTSAFRPVLTGKGYLDPERSFPSAERFMFPPKSPLDDCCLTIRDPQTSPQQPPNHQVKIKADHYPVTKSPMSLSPQTSELIIDDPIDKTDSYAEATVKRTPGTTSGTELDAGGSPPGGAAESHRDLGKAHAKAAISMEEAESPHSSPSDASVCDRLPGNRVQHPCRHLARESTTPSPATEDEDHAPHEPAKEQQVSKEMELRRKAYLAIHQKYLDSQATLNHFPRRLLSSHDVGLD
ncbi:SKI family transcriptional corepressor 1 homolog-B-like [Patiria miniata]|uniref:c-SKI SMAD4-binding domain-containing protein n=1 Tax=Patiria miniata TaxID=46514 RepID=A0A914BU60_PATMI|nr:SKI family transcriptional corepressor 1 homolog-B-like [Patiria miniata]